MEKQSKNQAPQKRRFSSKSAQNLLKWGIFDGGPGGI